MSEITANIKTLYANQEKTEVLFPRTKFEAISDNKGTSLKAYLNDAVYAADVDTDIGITSSPVEADRLEGHGAEYFAPKNYVDGMKDAIDKNLANNYLDKEVIENIYAPKSYVDERVADIIGGGEIVLDGYVTDLELQDKVQELQTDVLEAKTNAVNEA